jgi:urease accessory protein
MLEFTEHGRLDEEIAETVTLAYNERQKSRQRVILDSGTEAGIFLEHGKRLYGGDILRSSSGCCLQVVEATEPVTTVTTDDPRALACACYHLGNRHVPVQIDNTWIRYERDHVLDDMICGLDLEPIHEMAPFEPEHGAYDRHSHGHHHGHPHSAASASHNKDT